MATLNHIGIAVKDLEPLTGLLEVLDIKMIHTEVVLEQGVQTHFFPFSSVKRSQSHPKEGQLELLKATDPKGTIAQFLQKKGPGVHHLAFEVEKGELELICSKLQSKGYRLIYDAPQIGAHNMKVNFIHPSTAGGLLIELMEPGH